MVVDILSKSFEKNRSVNFVVGGKAARIPKLMGYCFDLGMEQGAVFLSDNSNAATILLFPEKKKTTIKSVMRDLKLALNVIGIERVLSVMKRESLLKERQPKNKFIHLWYIGVYPEESGKGVGSNLLREVIEFCFEKEKDIYLETSTERNINFYIQNGFDHYDTIKKGLPYDLMLFKRKILAAL
ncbi:GNAT family N-acetyltransferase [Euzebyella saccharophila]|uniref:GNAT family N-acetyltransferase n=1 Tax=Euzebyella saccharophila TaxID=679664 RepID=A0ABV8JSW0_9FLAO